MPPKENKILFDLPPKGEPKGKILFDVPKSTKVKKTYKSPILESMTPGERMQAAAGELISGRGRAALDMFKRGAKEEYALGAKHALSEAGMGIVDFAVSLPELVLSATPASAAKKSYETIRDYADYYGKELPEFPGGEYFPEEFYRRGVQEPIGRVGERGPIRAATQAGAMFALPLAFGKGVRGKAIKDMEFTTPSVFPGESLLEYTKPIKELTRLLPARAKTPSMLEQEIYTLQRTKVGLEKNVENIIARQEEINKFGGTTPKIDDIITRLQTHKDMAFKTFEYLQRAIEYEKDAGKPIIPKSMKKSLESEYQRNTRIAKSLETEVNAEKWKFVNEQMRLESEVETTRGHINDVETRLNNILIKNVPDKPSPIKQPKEWFSDWYNRYYYERPEIKSTTAEQILENTNKKPAIKTDEAGFVSFDATELRNKYWAWQDELGKLKHIDPKLEESYNWIERSPKRTAARIDKQLKYMFSEVDGVKAPDGMPLVELSKEKNYLLSGMDYYNRPKPLEFEITKEQITERLAAIDKRISELPPEQQAAVNNTIKKAREVSNGPLDYAVAKGVQSAENAATMKAINANRMPMFRELPRGVKALAKKLFPRRVGSKLPVKDVYENVVQDAATSYPRIDFEVHKRAVIGAALENPAYEGKVKEIFPTGTRATDMRAMFAQLKEMGIDTKGLTPEMVQEMFPFWAEPKTVYNEVSNLVNGKWKKYWLDDDLLQLYLKRGGPWPEGKTGMFLKAADKVGRIFKSTLQTGVTAAMQFAMGNIGVRDTLTRFYNDPNIASKPWRLADKVPKHIVLDLPRAVFEEFFNTFGKSDILKFMQEEGVGGTEFVEQMIRRPGQAAKFYYKGKGFRTFQIAKQNVSPITWFKKFSSFTERITRLAAYIDEIEGTIPKGRSTVAKMARENPELFKRAASKYETVTANFRRMGIRMKYGKDPVALWMKNTPFLSGAASGMREAFTTMHKHPLGSLAMVGSTIVPFSVFLWLRNHDKDWYKALDATTKNMYWFMEVRGKKIKAMKPWDWAIAGSMIERGLDFYETKDPAEAVGIAKAAVDALMPFNTSLVGVPMPMPVPVSAGAGLVSNIEPYFGGTINPQYAGEDYPHNISKPSTSEISKRVLRDLSPITDPMGITPPQVDFTVNALGGNLGRLGLKAADYILTGKQPERFWEEVTGVGRFHAKDISKTPHTKQISQFYGIVRDAANAFNAIEKHSETGKFKQRKHDAYDNYVRDALSEMREWRDEYNTARATKDKRGMESASVEMNRIANETLKKFRKEVFAK